MKKTIGRIITFCCAGALALTLVGCGGTSEPAQNSGAEEQPKQEEKVQPLDLTGEWMQTNKNSEDSYHTATITGDSITVNWITNGGDSKSLYWVGTYVAPTEATDSYTWESTADTEQLAGSLLGSGDEVKSFSYDKGTLSYEFTAMGTTTIVKMERV